jgi:hypothetical protein
MFGPFRRRRPPPPAAFEQALEAMHRAGQAQRDETDVMRDFRNTFLATDHGRRTLYEIMRFCHIYDPAPVGQGSDAEVRNAAARRDLGMHILSLAMGDAPSPDFQPLKETD